MVENILKRSWNAFSRERAAEYLKTVGHGSINSKRILADLLKERAKSQGMLSVIELGCGNAQVFDYFKTQGVACSYAGIDISEPLLEVAREIHPDAQFIRADLNELSAVTGRYDVALFSHVVEMLASPDRALLTARKFASEIMIRFYEPPNFEFDTVELEEMDVGQGGRVPCIRRKMSRDAYRLILTRMGCKSVEVYKDETSRDEVHVLKY